MTGPAADTGFLADPGAVIAGIVRDAEPSLDHDEIEAAITRAAPSRAQQRRLAAALDEDPGLLTSGRPEGPPQVELLIRDLQKTGARKLVLPRCAHCGEPAAAPTAVPIPSRRSRPASAALAPGQAGPGWTR